MTSLRITAALALSLFPALAACGNVQGGTGGSGGSGGSGASTGAGHAVCPDAEPNTGMPCFIPESTTCTFGACCGPQFRCVNGQWEGDFPPCLPPDQCLPSPPGEGSPCDPCTNGSPCIYDMCSDGFLRITATCTEMNVWHVEMGTCEGGPCNEVGCPAGEVCVQKSSDVDLSFACVPDPCGGAELSCDCAGSLCSSPFVCSIVNGDVRCECPACD